MSDIKKSKMFSGLANQNYSSWAFKMKSLLIRENCWDAIIHEGQANEAMKKKDEKALFLIILYLEDNQHVHVRSAATGKEAWENLKSYHLQATLSQRVYTQRKLLRIILGEGSSMEDHLNELSEVFHELEEMDMAIPDEFAVRIILSSIGEEYDPLISALEAWDKERLTLEAVRAKLLDEWRRKHHAMNMDAHTQSKDTAYPTNKREEDNRMCFDYGKEQCACCKCCVPKDAHTHLNSYATPTNKLEEDDRMCFDHGNEQYICCDCCVLKGDKTTNKLEEDDRMCFDYGNGQCIRCDCFVSKEDNTNENMKTAQVERMESDNESRRVISMARFEGRICQRKKKGRICYGCRSSGHNCAECTIKKALKSETVCRIVEMSELRAEKVQRQEESYAWCSEFRSLCKNWLINSGASNHMCCDRRLFYDMKFGEIQIAKGDTEKAIAGIKDEGKGFCVNLSGRNCLLAEPFGTSPPGSHKDGQYCLVKPKISLPMDKLETVCVHEWHKRLAHRNLDVRTIKSDSENEYLCDKLQSYLRDNEVKLDDKAERIRSLGPDIYSKGLRVLSSDNDRTVIKISGEVKSLVDRNSVGRDMVTYDDNEPSIPEEDSRIYEEDTKVDGEINRELVTTDDEHDSGEEYEAAVETPAKVPTISVTRSPVVETSPENRAITQSRGRILSERVKLPSDKEQHESCSAISTECVERRPYQEKARCHDDDESRNSSNDNDDGEQDDQEEEAGSFKLDADEHSVDHDWYYNGKDDYRRIKALSERQVVEFHKRPGNCKHDICAVCEAPEINDTSESCPYSSEPNDKKVAFSTRKSHNYKKSIIVKIGESEDENEEKKKLASAKCIGFFESGYFDSDLYDGNGTQKGKYKGYVTSIAPNEDEDEGDDEPIRPTDKRTGVFGAPMAFINDIARNEPDFDPFESCRPKTVGEKEDEYRRKRRKQVLSPARVDPFADGGKTHEDLIAKLWQER